MHKNCITTFWRTAWAEVLMKSKKETDPQTFCTHEDIHCRIMDVVYQTEGKYIFLTFTWTLFATFLPSASSSSFRIITRWKRQSHLKSYILITTVCGNTVRLGRVSVSPRFPHEQVCDLKLSQLSTVTLQFRLVHLILDKNLKTQSLLQHITSKNTSNVFT
jgi:hypothetical protein